MAEHERLSETTLSAAAVAPAAAVAAAHPTPFTTPKNNQRHSHHRRNSPSTSSCSSTITTILLSQPESESPPFVATPIPSPPSPLPATPPNVPSSIASSLCDDDCLTPTAERLTFLHNSSTATAQHVDATPELPSLIFQTTGPKNDQNVSVQVGVSPVEAAVAADADPDMDSDEDAADEDQQSQRGWGSVEAGLYHHPDHADDECDGDHDDDDDEEDDEDDDDHEVEHDHEDEESEHDHGLRSDTASHRSQSPAATRLHLSTNGLSLLPVSDERTYSPSSAHFLSEVWDTQARFYNDSKSDTADYNNLFNTKRLSSSRIVAPGVLATPLAPRHCKNHSVIAYVPSRTSSMSLPSTGGPRGFLRRASTTDAGLREEGRKANRNMRDAGRGLTPATVGEGLFGILSNWFGRAQYEPTTTGAGARVPTDARTRSLEDESGFGGRGFSTFSSDDEVDSNADSDAAWRYKRRIKGWNYGVGTGNESVCTETESERGTVESDYDAHSLHHHYHHNNMHYNNTIQTPLTAGSHPLSRGGGQSSGDEEESDHDESNQGYDHESKEDNKFESQLRKWWSRADERLSFLSAPSLPPLLPQSQTSDPSTASTSPDSQLAASLQQQPSPPPSPPTPKPAALLLNSPASRSSSPQTNHLQLETLQTPPPPPPIPQRQNILRAFTTPAYRHNSLLDQKSPTPRQQQQHQEQKRQQPKLPQNATITVSNPVLRPGSVFPPRASYTVYKVTTTITTAPTLQKHHHHYHMNPRSCSCQSVPTTTTTVVWKRYSEFRQLWNDPRNLHYRALAAKRTKDGVGPVFVFPPKMRANRFAEAVIEFRCHAFTELLNNNSDMMLLDPIARDEFLGIVDYGAAAEHASSLESLPEVRGGEEDDMGFTNRSRLHTQSWIW
ncbi:hypothetical protein DFJ77DRAFT_476722 [Powellomyces hirtus]|nr:hypothetical protein DFJ77DRAFT_476722 [Powellomyces hirtus]